MPAEICERILELAAQSEHGWPSVLDNSASIGAFALVCKAWLHAARRLLYRDIIIRDTERALLLYEVLKYTTPVRSALVTRLDVTYLWRESPIHGLVKLLDVTPHVVWLSLYCHQCRQLREHPLWARLKHLRLEAVYYGIDFRHSNEGDLVALPKAIISKDMPVGLEVLELKGNVGLALDAICWPGVFLRTVHTIKLDSGYADSHQKLLSKGKRLLPSAPNLRTFEISMIVESSASEDLAIKLVIEKGKHIANLRLHVLAKGHFNRSLQVLPTLVNLQVLDYHGPLSDIDKDTLRLSFPDTLQRLHLSWQGSPNIGVMLLELLPDINQIFLPNLQDIPSLIYCVTRDASEEVDGVTGWGTATEEQLRDLLKLSAETHNILMARCTSRRPILSAGQDDIVCLPFPQAYVSSLDDQQRSLMEAMMKSGELPSEAGKVGNPQAVALSNNARITPKR